MFAYPFSYSLNKFKIIFSYVLNNHHKIAYYVYKYHHISILSSSEHDIESRDLLRPIKLIRPC